MILPEWRACGFSKLEHVIQNGFNALPAKSVHHFDVTARKKIFRHGIKIITLFPINDFILMHSSPNVLCLKWWKNYWYLHYEIGCLPIAVRHVQMLKRAATSFVLSSFGLLMAIRLATRAVMSYIKCGAQSKLSVYISWIIIWTACEMPWMEIIRFLCACFREIELIISIDGGWKNFRFVVLNLCHNLSISV